MASANWHEGPRPFIPPVDVMPGFPPQPRRQATHPMPVHPRPPLPQGMFKPVAPGMAGPVPPMPRGVSSQTSQVPPVPYPHPEHAPHHLRLPPRPMGHGRSGSSAPAHDIIPPPEPTTLPRSTRTHAPEKVHVQIPVDRPHQQGKPVTSTDKSPYDKDLPKAPNPGGLGLFATTPVEPAPPASAPIPIFAPPPPPPPPTNVRRPAGVRRATVSECQRLPTPETENEKYIEEEHARQDKMWEEEQAQRLKEIEEERRKYAEERVRSAHVQQAHHQRNKSVDSVLTPPPDSPVMNEHGIPSPPPTMSPPSKALKRSISTKDDRERWRVEIREVMDDQMRRQEEAKAAFEAAMKMEQERLRRENARRDRARLEAEAERMRIRQQQAQQRPQPQAPQPPPRIYPEPAYPKAKAPTVAKRDNSKNQLRPRRKGQRDSGYLSSGRSADGYGRGATTATNWKFTRAKRYYGEGSTDLREEGVKSQRVEEDEDEEWQDVEAVADAGESSSFMKAAWTLYETGWKRLFDTPPEVNSLRFMDIPWPSSEPLPLPTSPRSPKSKGIPLPPTALQISAVLNQRSISKFLLSPHHSAGKSSRARLRAALLRFHPDKVARWLSLIQESERDAVVMGVEIVVRCLNELMRKATDEPVA